MVCIPESSDFGAALEPTNYYPNAEVDGNKGGVLLLLHELRAHRMSHFQLIRLPLAALSAQIEVN